MSLQFDCGCNWYECVPTVEIYRGLCRAGWRPQMHEDELLWGAWPVGVNDWEPDTQLVEITDKYTHEDLMRDKDEAKEKALFPMRMMRDGIERRVLIVHLESRMETYFLFDKDELDLDDYPKKYFGWLPSFDAMHRLVMEVAMHMRETSGICGFSASYCR